MGGIPAVKTLVMILVMTLLLALSGGNGLAHTQMEKTFYLQSRMVLQLNPRDATAGNAVGTWHLEYNQRDQAKVAFKAVLKHDPGNFLAQMGLALAGEIEGRLAEALGRIAAITAYPSRFGPFLGLVRGRLNFKAGRHGEAESLLQGALRLALRQEQNPHDYYHWLGRLREAARRDDEALQYYRKAVIADPFWIEPYSRMSLIYQRRGEEKKAAAVLREIVALDNPSPYPNNDIMVMWRWVMRRR